ncbi:FAD/NAD(P)-binding domain-containing protein [Polychaeton citri CBS 116435]|uniref:FAD/NAD(P)-binding domain-containing protein n=1 Tax=Polychaeton citri CBS 116435 TaxID=1314669 RepID=A0A9P4Q4W7_9PEZI|nr:FAD/NAD(P)-binding domain-containing protein [Polychaeton citri CBS 116435]
MALMGVKDLHICIIGAGMGGLATALALAKQGFMHIDVYESASNLGFVGAGIQLAPNMARILDRFGCWKAIEAEAVELHDTSIRASANDDELAHVGLQSIRQKYGYPHMVGHRASLAGSIYDACRRESTIAFHFATSIGQVRSFGPQPSFIATPRNDQPYEVKCDILLAADGVKSNVRDQMLAVQKISAKVVDTGQAAYRIMLTREQMSSDPELLALIDSNRVTRWIGDRRHIIAYPVASKQIYNLSTTQPDRNFAAAPSATYTTKGSKDAMLDTFTDFCPVVQKMLNLVPEGEVCEWRLRVHERLPTWLEGSTALVGDACHPTLPHLAQGAAQAIEDAAVIGVVLSKLPSTDPNAIHRALEVYEEVRRGRAYALVDLAAASGRTLHLGEGGAKEERDRMFAALKAGSKIGEVQAVPDKWADAEVQRMIYSVDVMAAAEERFNDLFYSGEARQVKADTRLCKMDSGTSSDVERREIAL